MERKPEIRFHDLRHKAASLMLNHGIPVIIVARRLGHSNASVMLNIYAHTTVDMQNEAASLMDELITPIPVNLPQGELAVKEEILLHPVAPNCTHLHPIEKIPDVGDPYLGVSSFLRYFR